MRFSAPQPLCRNREYYLISPKISVIRQRSVTVPSQRSSISALASPVISAPKSDVGKVGIALNTGLTEIKGCGHLQAVLCLATAFSIVDDSSWG